ncbi:hypothetical protein AVEN_61010-1 [Araneus ventricosus]|uniref:Uncharacterized protein n=1 Tax=Araneus ventricosus TaxID=182803 RepID=A0A4Y2DDK1_ARAVE|nr:hypothetical protein AVEN_61010-1 [Araneus ventricosus]
MIEFRYHILHKKRGPRWPSDTVSALRPEGLRFENPIPMKTRHVCEPVASQIVAKGAKRLPPERCGILKRGCQLRCHPSHLTAFQNYDVRPKIAILLLQNGTFMQLN